MPLVSREAESARSRTWLRKDQVAVVWSLTATEVVSALAHKRREGALSEAHFAAAKRRLAALEQAWSEVAAWDAVRARARRLLEVHTLAAADALQLAAALVLVEERPEGLGFVTFDERLGAAGRREGFGVLGTG